VLLGNKQRRERGRELREVVGAERLDSAGGSWSSGRTGEMTHPAIVTGQAVHCAVMMQRDVHHVMPTSVPSVGFAASLCGCMLGRCGVQSVPAEWHGQRSIALQREPQDHERYKDSLPALHK